MSCAARTDWPGHMRQRDLRRGDRRKRPVVASYYHKASARCASLSPPAGGFFLIFQPCHAALVIDIEAATRGPLAIALHGSHPALKATRFAVLVWHTGRVTKYPIALFVLSAVADPESFLGQQQIVDKK